MGTPKDPESVTMPDGSSIAYLLAGIAIGFLLGLWSCGPTDDDDDDDDDDLYDDKSYVEEERTTSVK